MVKSVASGPGSAPTAPNPAMAARTGSVPMDEGRAWAGDLYEEGTVSDPAQAFARFQGDDTEAWLDRNEDGTLTAWVQDGADVYRYSDPEAWALDVDGAGMQRTDEAPPEVPDDAEELAEEAPTDDEGEANPFAEDGADTAITPPVEEEGPDPEVTVPEDAEEFEDAAAAQAAETPGEEQTGATDEPDDEDDEDLPESLALFRRGKTEKKHMLGEHNQETHGNWSEGIAPGPRHDTSGSSGSSGGGGTRPKGATPKQASITPETLKHMSDDELDAVAGATDLYDMPTMLAVAAEMDSRDDLHNRVMDGAADTTPGSPDRAGVYDSVIPAAWQSWVAQGAQGRRPRSRDKRKEIDDAYQDWWWGQYQRAIDATAGYLFKRAYMGEKNRPFEETSFFNGAASRAQVRKYASEELLRFFGEDPRKTFTEFAAEFYPSYRKAANKVGSSYLSEFG